MDPSNERLQAGSVSVVEEQVPKRSNFWFSKSNIGESYGFIFDKITTVFSLTLAAFAFVVFWPIVSQINFEEAFFTPLMPILISIFNIFGLEQNDAVRLIFTVSFAVSTVGIYLLVRDLTKRQVTAILSAIIFMVPPVPIFVLTFLRTGLFANQLSEAKSFFTIVYGDGTHFFALALIPFAVLFFLRYLKRDSNLNLVLSVFFAALILLCNRSQALNLSLALLISFVTESILGNARLKFKRFLLVSVLSVGIVSFWYTPDFWIEGILLFFKQISLNIRSFFPLPFIVGVLSLFFSFVFFGKRADRQPIFISFLLFLTFLYLIFEWVVSGKSIMPHPQRLLPNLNMFGAIVVALSLSALFDKTRIVEKLGFERWPSSFRIFGALVFGVVSFAVITFFGYILSPGAILAFSGGIWTRLRLEVMADRQEALRVAGGNFNLVYTSGDNYQQVFGYMLSLLFLILLLVLLFRGTDYTDERTDYTDI